MFNAFSILVGLGATLGLAWVAWRTQRLERMPQRQVDYRITAGLFSLFGAIIGARAAYVGANWGYFQTHVDEAAQVWLGGLSWIGAVIAAILAIIGYAAVAQISLGALADALLPLGLMVTLGSWLGCMEAGCAYGAPTLPGQWWGLPTWDDWGQVIPRFPLQLLGALTSLLVFMAIEWLRPRLPHPGQAASLALLIFSAQMTGLSFLRADPVPLWRNQRLDSWAGIFLLALSLLVCLVAFLPGLRRQPEPERMSQRADSV
ncbi:MAG TPA: prolipoprotein diacylglyceryl transferase family protein [Anaerolineaceae bacterium]|nr:prolipoprotein diacylglyceryl transferase family protein [Anaerolineaceae bacterium]